MCITVSGGEALLLYALPPLPSSQASSTCFTPRRHPWAGIRRGGRSSRGCWPRDASRTSRCWVGLCCAREGGRREGDGCVELSHTPPLRGCRRASLQKREVMADYPLADCPRTRTLPPAPAQILDRWLWEGVLDDPHAEFMVQESKVSQSVGHRVGSRAQVEGGSAAAAGTVVKPWVGPGRCQGAPSHLFTPGVPPACPSLRVWGGTI